MVRTMVGVCGVTNDIPWTVRCVSFGGADRERIEDAKEFDRMLYGDEMCDAVVLDSRLQAGLARGNDGS